MSLTPKQQRFVQEYIIDLNATKAAIRAGYSAKTADQQGPRLLGHPEIAKGIAAAQKKIADKAGITAERVLQELGRLAFADPRQLFDADGKLLRPSELSDDAAAALASIEVVTRKAGEGEVEYVAKTRGWDKNAALLTLAKHLKLLTDLPATGNITIEIKQYAGNPPK